MTHAQKPDFVFLRKGRVHLNRRRRQFSRLLAAEVCAPTVVMLGTPCFEIVWSVVATHSIHQFPLHFPSRASPCAITFQLESTSCCSMNSFFCQHDVFMPFSWFSDYTPIISLICLFIGWSIQWLVCITGKHNTLLMLSPTSIHAYHKNEAESQSKHN